MSLISRIENYRYRWWHLPFWITALPWIIVILAPIGFLICLLYDNSVKIAASVFLHDRFLNPPDKKD